jgi:hypothetical protein
MGNGLFGGVDLGCFWGGGVGLAKGGAGFVNLKLCPIRTNRRCW